MTVKVFLRCIWVSFCLAIVASLFTTAVFTTPADIPIVVEDQNQLDKLKQINSRTPIVDIISVPRRQLKGWELVKYIFSDFDFFLLYFKSTLIFFSCMLVATTATSYLNTRQSN
ncbi:hypothetical protein ACVBEJ_05960 [Porticoccus sp. GXU_MW_L64]